MFKRVDITPSPYSVTLRWPRSGPRRATATRSAVADLDTQTNSDFGRKPEIRWPCILRGSLRSQLRMTVFGGLIHNRKLPRQPNDLGQKTSLFRRLPGVGRASGPHRDQL